MPLVVYQNAHGNTDYPHHYAFFEAMEQRGLLDRVQFALDTFMDLSYCRELVRRFPQLVLAADVSAPRRVIQWLRDLRLNRGYSLLTRLDRFDAVCEAPGGRLNPCYTRADLFWKYPKVRRRAILFHSVEEGVVSLPVVRDCIASAELVVARTSCSAEMARMAGARRVIVSSDIVFRTQPQGVQYRPGIAAAFRLPNLAPSPEYMSRLRAVLKWMEESGRVVDHVRVEAPIGKEMVRRYGLAECPRVSLYGDATMYVPFKARRDAIISSRLHTTILALLHGNRNIMQFHIEDGTTKLQQFCSDLGLSSLPMHTRDDVCVEKIKSFIDQPTALPEEQVGHALSVARRRVEEGLDATQEWLESL